MSCWSELSLKTSSFCQCFFLYVYKSVHCVCVCERGGESVCVRLVLWHINHCWLFYTKSSFYNHIRYMICIISYQYHIISYQYHIISISYHIISYHIILWHINHCWLFYTKSSFYNHIRYMICIISIISYHIISISYHIISYQSFYGISIIVGYFIPNPVFTIILDI